MKKRSDKNSATSAVAGFVGAINDRIPLPAGVELRSEAELIIWHQFTRARMRSDWRDMDLILLAKIVNMEADIRAAQIELDAMGIMIENKRGIANSKSISIGDRYDGASSAGGYPINVVKSNGL